MELFCFEKIQDTPFTLYRIAPSIAIPDVSKLLPTSYHLLFFEG